MCIWLARISKRGARLSSSPVRVPSIEAVGDIVGWGGDVENCRFAQEKHSRERARGGGAVDRRRERRRVVTIMEEVIGDFIGVYTGDPWRGAIGVLNEILEMT